MAVTGIRTLVLSDGSVWHKKQSPWGMNVKLNRWPMANLLLIGKESLKEFLARVYALQGLYFVDISAFISNDNLIHLSTLYPERRITSVAFSKVRGTLSLLCIGSKTLSEYRLIGIDYRKESKVPLLFSASTFESNLTL